MPDPEQTRNRNGDHETLPRGQRIPSSIQVPPTESPRRASSFLPVFLGGFIAIVVIAVIGAVIFIVSQGGHATASNAKSKSLLEDAASWRLGQDAAKQLDGKEQPDIGWWTRTFDLPKQDIVADYLKNQGLTVGKIVPAHYEDTKDDTTVTYDVYAEVPAQLLRLKQTTWRPSDPDTARFAKVLVLNDGLPAGTMWDTQHPAVAAEAGTKLNFAWQVKWDKNFNTVTTDRLPFTDNVVTQQQAGGYQTESGNAITQLQNQIQQINTQVQTDTQVKLTQVPADPPKPELKSTKWNHGDGSGEPTKSAERMGGATAAGAAGGAAFGAAAGDAGLGAGIGAAVGLLGGIIYDTVSKNNDREKYQRQVTAENAERMDEWRAQIKHLNKQRNQIQQDAIAEKQRALDDLANSIAANHGRLDGAPVTVSNSDAPQLQPVEAAPGADQPSGPIVANPAANAAPIQSNSATDSTFKQKLLGYWKSPRHAYFYSKDGSMQMVGGDPKNKWDIVNGVYHEVEDDGRDYAYDIVTLTDNKFVYRSRGDNPTTFTLGRISKREAEEYRYGGPDNSLSGRAKRAGGHRESPLNTRLGDRGCLPFGSLRSFAAKFR